MSSTPKKMPFDGALWGLRRGARMTREAWGRPAPWVFLVVRPGRIRIRAPFNGPVMRVARDGWDAPVATAMDIDLEPMFLQQTLSGNFVVWLPTAVDLLASDWMEYDR